VRFYQPLPRLCSSEDVAKTTRNATFFIIDIENAYLADTITLLPWIRTLSAEETGLQLVTHKCVVISSRARSAGDDVFNVLQQQEGAVQRDGGVIMGVPFGTDDFVDHQLSKGCSARAPSPHSQTMVDRQRRNDFRN